MSEEQRRQLDAQLWGIANLLRGKVDPDDYRDYILGFIFYKYLSEKQHLYADELLKGESVTDFELVKDQETLDAIQEESLISIGYFLKPEELFSSITKRGNTNSYILDDLQSVLNHIEQSTSGTESEDDFNALFEDLDLNSTKLGRTPNARNEIIVNILTYLDEIDFRLDEVESDVIGDAYEYLIAKFASGAGKSAGEFYTPQQVSKILSKIITTGKTKLKSVYDPTCGSGSLLLRVAREVEVGEFYGQELNRTTFNLARMNMILHDVHYRDFDIRQEDTLEEPQHLDKRFEGIVANPPFSLNWKSDANPLYATDERFSQYGRLAPKSKADLAFVQHMVYQLADNGIVACVLPHGVLFRGSSEEVIRKYLIKDLNYLDAVIGLPSNIFFGTGIPTCILVLKKCREQDEDIIFIDASGDDHFIKVGKQNELRDEDVELLVNTYRNRESIDKYSSVVTLKEIEENDYNLNIPRYVDTFEEEEDVDLSNISSFMNETEEIFFNNIKQIQYTCNELKIPYPSGVNIDLWKEFKKGVMKKIFNQEIRFKDNNGNDFPDWEEYKMGEIIDILSDYTANGSFGGLKENVQYYTEINFAALVRTTDLEKKLFNPQRFTDKRGYDYLSKTSLFGGEIIMANVGSIGKIYRCPESSFPMTLAPNTYMIKFKKNLINEGFIFQLMKRKTFKNKLLSMVGSSTLKAINKKNLRSIKVNIPSMEEQDKLNDFLFSIDTQLKLLESQIDKSKTWKKGLLQKMFV